MPPRRHRNDLAAFAEGLAARLPDTWTSTYTRHAAYHDQIATTSKVWDIGAVGYATSNFVLGDQAVLVRPDGARLLVFDRPLYRAQFMIGALEPDAHHDAFHGVAEPFGIAIPCDPARAASQVGRRLLPRYEDALRQVRHNTAHPVPRRPEPALIAGAVSMAWHPDGAVGAVTGVREATAVLYSAGFQYHPHHRQFLLPAAYGDREQIARVQTVSQQLARIGVGVTMHPARHSPAPVPLPARAPTPAAASPAR
ncbi:MULTISPECIES: hypothetical protein [Streptomyces]|uniref:hypothetical protein n=1 Tax=Streptomyces TaxID=1883 RepID=UPI00227082DF|nr:MULTISPECIES: hypothetical protein [unclassified Streptomyces]MCY0940250.1 hypothetical protein [Streptomyces sp. H34-AA3]MCZ4080897.1 hypothetical protein [Streptomyces sp. H34-S5]